MESEAGAVTICHGESRFLLWLNVLFLLGLGTPTSQVAVRILSKFFGGPGVNPSGDKLMPREPVFGGRKITPA